MRQANTHKQRDIANLYNGGGGESIMKSDTLNCCPFCGNQKLEFANSDIECCNCGVIFQFPLNTKQHEILQTWNSRFICSVLLTAVSHKLTCS